MSGKPNQGDKMSFRCSAKRRFSFKAWVAALAGGAALLSTTQNFGQQPFAIETIGFGADGTPRLRVPADVNSYYILYRGDSIAAIGLAADLGLGKAVGTELKDRDPATGVAARFYRVERVPLGKPRDSDGDGIDDVYELMHASILNPLNPQDAKNDSDGDGKTNLQEYLAGTDPGGGANRPPLVIITADSAVYVSPANVRLGVNAQDPDGQILKVEYYSGSLKIGESRTSPFGFSWSGITPGVYSVSAVATDNLGASGTSRPLDVVVNVPIPVVDALPAATPSESIRVTGKALANSRVRIEGALAPVSVVAGGNGSFSADVPLFINRLNRIFVRSSDANGHTSSPVSFDILEDSQPPNLFVDFPATGSQVSTETVVVAGRVGDMLSGFMGLDVTVQNLSTGADKATANVIVGIGQNGTFERGNVALQMGPNTIEVTARDQHGNEIVRRTELVRVELSGPQMAVVSGDGQKAPVHQRLPNSVVVRVARADGTPIPNKLVTFDIIRSDGLLSESTAIDAVRKATLAVSTDSDGLAKALWQMGGDAGCGNNRIVASSKDIAGKVFFCASALPAEARQINVGSGNNQQAEAGGSPPEALRAWVNDSCNPVAGVPITFKVTKGTGKVNGQAQVTVASSQTGHASVVFTGGLDGGDATVEANFEGNPKAPAVFSVKGILRVAGRGTSFGGVVLDNAHCPVGGARAVLTVGTDRYVADSDLTGRFYFPNVTPGPARLRVDGLVATQLNGLTIPAGSFPFLTFSPVLVPNAENSLDNPVLLPRLNPANAVFYDGTRDVVLTCEGIAGLRMTVKAGSMRRVDGSKPSPSDPAIISLNQVHHDDIPMPIPDGASPPFAWTLQPALSTFDPPIRIEYPNMSGLPARSIAYFLTFNHDTERFEIVASGHVTNDGARIITDPGVGLNIAGWGCNCPPYSVTGSCGCN